MDKLRKYIKWTGKGISKRRNKVIQICLIIFSVIALIGLGLLLFETFPRYIVLPVLPPDSYKGSRLGGDWESTTYAVKLKPILPPVQSRVFIWRKEAGGVYDKDHGFSSWKDIISYFDQELSSNGWVRSDAYAPCQFYLPEANFLPVGEEGYIWYREKTYLPTLDFHGGNFICLAVWSDPEFVSYKIVIISVNQSPLDFLMSIG